MNESTVNETPANVDEANEPDDTCDTSSLKKRCCDWRHFEGIAKAQGFACVSIVTNLAFWDPGRIITIHTGHVANYK